MKGFVMDVLKIAAGAVLVAAFAGSLLVRNAPAEPGMAAVLPPICGVEQSGHAAAAPDPMVEMGAALGDGHKAMMEAMGPMHTDMMAGMMAPDFEVAFVCGMIPHHQGAVDMARAALKFGSDPWVTMFAQEIVVTQEREIGQMQAWLARKQPKS
jgi:hypothetical protein